MTRLVLLHAATRDRHDFRALLDVLPELAGDALPLDLLGHGDAPRAPRYRLTDFADAAQAAMGDDPVVLYGHSLGGLVAAAVASRRPGQVAGLVLEDPPVFGSQLPRLLETSFYRGFMALKSLMEGPGAGRTGREWEADVANWPSGHGRSTMAQVFGPRGVAMRARQIARFDPAVIGAMVSGELHEGFDIMAALRSVACPAVVLVGEEGRNSALSRADVARLAGETPLRVERVAGEGHFIHETLPAPCAAAVRRVLEPVR